MPRSRARSTFCVACGARMMSAFRVKRTCGKGAAKSAFVVNTGDDVAVIGPINAGACPIIPNCQFAAGSALLIPGSYYLEFTGTGGGTSGYGGNLYARRPWSRYWRGTTGFDCSLWRPDRFGTAAAQANSLNRAVNPRAPVRKPGLLLLPNPIPSRCRAQTQHGRSETLGASSRTTVRRGPGLEGSAGNS